MGVAVMPFVGGDNLADFFVIDVIFGDILDLFAFELLDSEAEVLDDLCRFVPSFLRMSLVRDDVVIRVVDIALVSYLSCVGRRRVCLPSTATNGCWCALRRLPSALGPSVLLLSEVFSTVCPAKASSFPRGEGPHLESPRRTLPSLRAPGLPFPRCASAPSPCTRTFSNDGDSDFTIDTHHGSKFHYLGNGLEYLGGKVLEDMHYELDEWSLQEIVSAKIWYCEPGCQLSSGLRELMSDGDAMRMGRLLVLQTVKHCSVYVVDGCRKGNGVEICSNDKAYVPTEAEYNESGFVEVEVECESEASSEEDRFDDSADDGDHEDHFGFDVENGNDGGVGNGFGGFYGPLNEHDNAQTAGVDAAVNDAAIRDDVEVGEISEGYETEDIDSYEGGSDDIIKKRRYLKYNEAEMSR
ncbi:uncharacterized protein LOC110269524 [Arachis ipaensis]|uniref:uncharacterized protein LOC110269524 n=1 Tax=Arachis ipaensis TaxID=130454 RepID=UPI000A2B3616|nr:uncharacterized protein LOC110269524 [Arachis ipaensis]